MGKVKIIEYEDDDFGNIDDVIADIDAIKNGVDIDVGGGKCIRITSAGVENRKYNVSLSEFAKEYGINIQVEELEEDEAVYMFRRAFCESVILGWSGFKTKDGADKPYSKESAMAFFQKSPMAWQMVYKGANNFAYFSIEGRKEAGN